MTKPKRFGPRYIVRKMQWERRFPYDTDVVLVQHALFEKILRSKKAGCRDSPCWNQALRQASFKLIFSCKKQENGAAGRI